MKLEIGFKEIAILSIFFTGLAIYLDIHHEKQVLSFTINHTVSLLLALLISKLVYNIYKKNK